MYDGEQLAMTGMAGITICGLFIENTFLYILIGIMFILVGFRFLRLIYKENK